MATIFRGGWTSFCRLDRWQNLTYINFTKCLISHRLVGYCFLGLIPFHSRLPSRFKKCKIWYSLISLSLQTHRTKSTPFFLHPALLDPLPGKLNQLLRRHSELNTAEVMDLPYVHSFGGTLPSSLAILELAGLSPYSVVISGGQQWRRIPGNTSRPVLSELEVNPQTNHQRVACPLSIVGPGPI